VPGAAPLRDSRVFRNTLRPREVERRSSLLWTG
jgi:hypothetical protein